MALALSPLNLLTSSSSSSPSHLCSSSFSFLALQPQTLLPNTFRTLKFKPCFCYNVIQVETHKPNLSKVPYEAVRKKRKPKPSFYEQIRKKWSLKTGSPREKFPWQVQEQQEQQELEEVECKHSSGDFVSDSENHGSSSRSDPMSFAFGNRSVSAPWIHGRKTRKQLSDSEITTVQNCCGNDENVDGLGGYCENNDGNGVDEMPENIETEVNCDGRFEEEVEIEANPVGDEKFKEEVNIGATSINVQESTQVSLAGDVIDAFLNDENRGSNGLPWKREQRLELTAGDWRRRRSNTKLADSILPEHELKRLRNVSLRMLERIKVGAAGVTQALVDSIHEKWALDEVVKLKFEGLSALNMKRIHETIENRTGGLVIWRSGSSMVLYRGMTYKLPCVQKYAKQNLGYEGISQSLKNLESYADSWKGMEGSVAASVAASGSSASVFVEHGKELSEKELMNISELNQLLDDLGPRFIDWSGPHPLPVDADLLPCVVPGYKRPFRLLPHGMRHCLRNRRMTKYRRLARTMPPHFALGRNRELHGLAIAMVRLWEKSAIAKIAIKRGVHNTCNERMAEELKKLTGGTLLSRNKDYIVFYRGNDFLPPAVTEKLIERQELTVLQQDEEEQARQRALPFIDLNAKPAKIPFVAGTLAETMAATSRWKNQLSQKDIEKMLSDSAMARHASLVRYLEKKLHLAKEKVKKAENALAKVQKYLEPAELPTDLETLTDEERFLFRKIGLSMKPYLFLGTRGIFDGTIENMHLHWKYRELVKLIVKRKSFAQVKHMAISLEAESGGVLVSVDKTTQGHVIIVYRGKNYQRPIALRPNNLLTRRQALARSIELQRREALKHHILDVQEKIELLKCQLEEMMTVKEIDGEIFYARINDDDYSSDDDMDEGEQAYLEVYDSSNEDSDIQEEEPMLDR